MSTNIWVVECLHEIWVISCETNIKNKLSICLQFSQILVTFVLFGDERPDFTGMQSKSDCTVSATWSCNATGMVALNIDISNSTNIIISKIKLTAFLSKTSQKQYVELPKTLLGEWCDPCNHLSTFFEDFFKVDLDRNYNIFEFRNVDTQCYHTGSIARPCCWKCAGTFALYSCEIWTLISK